MLGVGQKREGKVELFGHLSALSGLVDADGQYLSAKGFEFVIVTGQTGQLLPAVGSPIASVEDQDQLGFPDEF
jgi:hypothetical protein